jgi:hypothetical protein
MDERSCRRPDSGALDTKALIVMAESVELQSRAKVPILPILAELERALADCEAQATLPASERPNPFVRMRSVVDELRRDAAGGRVQSIGGLAAEARRLVRELDSRNLVTV